MLEEISDFVKLAEHFYFYDNSANRFGLYSSRSYNPNENGFKIKTTECTIICKLIHKDNQKITLIDINRHKGHKTTTSFKFVESNWSDPLDNTEDNHIVLNKVISTIWDYAFGLCSAYIDPSDERYSFYI